MSRPGRGRTLGAWLGLAALAGLLAAGCGAGSTPVQMPGAVVNKGSVDDSASGSAFAATIDVGDDYFSPTFIKAPAGAHVTLHLVDTGEATHSFTIDSVRIDKILDHSGQTARVNIVMPANGSPAIFYCKYHLEVGMQGAFYSEASAG